MKLKTLPLLEIKLMQTEIKLNGITFLKGKFHANTFFLYFIGMIVFILSIAKTKKIYNLIIINDNANIKIRC